MTKHDRETLASLQSAPFLFVPTKTAERLIAAGMATVASVQPGPADAAEYPDHLPISCTLEGLSHGKTDDKSEIGAISNGEE